MTCIEDLRVGIPFILFLVGGRTRSEGRHPLQEGWCEA